MSTSPHETLAPAHPEPAAAPGNGRPAWRVGGVELSPAEIVRRPVNGTILDRSDPLEGAGAWLRDFSFAIAYPVDRDQQEKVVRELFGNVYGHVRDQSIPDAKVQVVDFDDVGAGNAEKPRRYVLIDAETRRRTHMSVFATFCGYGDHLYVSVQSFVLPPLSIWRATLAILFSFVLLRYGGAVSGVVGLGGLGLLLSLGVVAWYFRDVIRSLLAGDPPGLALRRRFPGRENLGTFNRDDVLMHFKSTVSLTLHAIQEVFEDNDIPIDVLERVGQTVDMSTNVSVNGGILNILGSIVGGAGNQASAPRS